MGQSAIVDLSPNTSGNPITLMLQPDITGVSKYQNTVSYTLSNFNNESVAVQNRR